MTIENWANDQEIVGNYLKFPKMDPKVLEFVFLDDGKRGEKFPGSDRVPVEFLVEKEDKQWKFNTSSRRLLNQLEDIANQNNSLLAGVGVKITKSGDGTDTQYKVELLTDFKTADNAQTSEEPAKPIDQIE